MALMRPNTALQRAELHRQADTEQPICGAERRVMNSHERGFPRVAHPEHASTFWQGGGTRPEPETDWSPTYDSLRGAALHVEPRA